MGFFSDLKDDLSQAVNELAPEDGLQAVQDGANAAEDMEIGRASCRERV